MTNLLSFLIIVIGVLAYVDIDYSCNTYPDENIVIFGIQSELRCEK